MTIGLILLGRRVSDNRGARESVDAIGCNGSRFWIILRSSSSMLEFC
jgi:hypothetical protein